MFPSREIFTFFNRIHNYIVEIKDKSLSVQSIAGTGKSKLQARGTAQGVTKLCLKLGIPAPAFDKQEAFNATV